MTEGQEPQGQQTHLGHPAYQEYLEGVPTDLQPIVIKAFQEWDKGVESKLQGVRSEYEAYQPLVENEVPMETIQQSLWLAQQLEQNPQGIVQQAIDSFGLDYVLKEVADSTNNDNTDNEDGELEVTDLSGLENHPAFKQLKEQAEAHQEWLEQQAEAEKEQASLQELEEYLEVLHKDPANGDFDDLYVTALMAQGVDGEEAVKQFQQTVAAAAAKLGGQVQGNRNTVPVVMGGDGNAGSGVPNEPVQFGAMKRNALNDVVMNYLNANQNQ